MVLDPALTSRIFRVANSAAYGAKATNVSEAIRYIGFKRVRELVFNAGVLSQFSSMAKCRRNGSVFWLRNIFIARLSERIAGTYFPTDGTEYLAGSDPRHRLAFPEPPTFRMSSSRILSSEKADRRRRRRKSCPSATPTLPPRSRRDR